MASLDPRPPRTVDTLPRTHHAVVVDRPGGPEQLRWQDHPVPTLGDRDVLVRTHAAGLNFLETYQRSGVYPMQTPFIPGSEGSGVVVALSADVSTVQLGDRVATAGGRGTYAEHFLVHEDQVLPVPEELDLLHAAAVPLQGMTAHYLCRSTTQVHEGQTVVVTAGAGGVGLLLTQMCAHLGARVITTASTEQKRRRSLAAGASASVDYPDLLAAVLEQTDGVGADVVFDGVGKATFEDSLAALRTRGLLVLFGGASGQVPPFDLQRLNSGGGLYVTRPALTHYTRDREEVRGRADEIFTGLKDGWLRLTVGETFELPDAASAHRALEGRGTTGKVLLVLR